jgi:hypothetical protein
MMQISKLKLQLDQWMVGSSDIAGSAGTRPEACRGRNHRPDDIRMLPHPEIIVRAPDHDLARTRPRVPSGVGDLNLSLLAANKKSIPQYPRAIDRGRRNPQDECVRSAMQSIEEILTGGAK